MREVGQGPGDERGAAGGEQSGGLGVAPLGAQAAHQPLGEPVSAAVPDDPGQLPAQGAGGAGEGFLDRLVRDALGAGGAQGVSADHRVGVGQPLGQVAGGAAGRCRERGQPPAVYAGAFQVGQQPGKLAVGVEFPGPAGEEPLALRVGERVEVGEQLIGFVRHAVILAGRSGCLPPDFRRPARVGRRAATADGGFARRRTGVHRCEERMGGF